MKGESMSLFWTATESMPYGMGFALYGREHLIWLGCIAVFTISMCAAAGKADPKTRRKLYLGVCISCLVWELFGDAVLLSTGQFTLNYLPLDLCGIAIYGEFLCCLRPRPLLKELCFCLFMPGALAALAFSNWVYLPWWNFFAVRSFVIHAFLVAYPLMMAVSGDLRPDARKLPKCFAIGIAMCIPIYFIDKALDQNFFFLNWPSPGSPLVWFEEKLGNPGYQIGLPIMLLAVWVVIYLPIVIIDIIRRNEVSK